MPTQWAFSSALTSGWFGVRHRSPMPPRRRPKVPTCLNMSVQQTSTMAKRHRLYLQPWTRRWRVGSHTHLRVDLCQTTSPPMENQQRRTLVRAISIWGAAFFDHFGRRARGRGVNSGPHRCGDPLHNRWCFHLRGGCARPARARNPSGIGATFAFQNAHLAIPEPLPLPSDRDRGPMGLALTSQPCVSHGGLCPSDGRRSATSGGQGREHRPATRRHLQRNCWGGR